jgi:hypothetical protein
MGAEREVEGTAECAGAGGRGVWFFGGENARVGETGPGDKFRLGESLSGRAFGGDMAPFSAAFGLGTAGAGPTFSDRSLIFDAVPCPVAPVYLRAGDLSKSSPASARSLFCVFPMLVILRAGSRSFKGFQSKSTLPAIAQK